MQRKNTTLTLALGLLWPSLGACAAPAQPVEQAPTESRSTGRVAQPAPERPSPRTLSQPAQPESGRLAGYLQTIRQAPDPSSAIEAYAQARQTGDDPAALANAYVLRMVDFGLPEMAEAQALDLTKREPENGLAWGVEAYMNAKRSETRTALEDIVLATKFAPRDDFVLRTAGQLLAWYDVKADQSELSQSLRDSLKAMRRNIAERKTYSDSYDRAKETYQQQDKQEKAAGDDGNAGAGVPVPAEAAPAYAGSVVPPQPPVISPSGSAPVYSAPTYPVTEAAPSTTYIYNNTYYDTAPYAYGYVPYTDPFLSVSFGYGYYHHRPWYPVCDPFWYWAPAVFSTAIIIDIDAHHHHWHDREWDHGWRGGDHWDGHRWSGHDRDGLVGSGTRNGVGSTAPTTLVGPVRSDRSAGDRPAFSGRPAAGPGQPGFVGPMPEKQDRTRPTVGPIAGSNPTRGNNAPPLSSTPPPRQTLPPSRTPGFVDRPSQPPPKSIIPAPPSPKVGPMPMPRVSPAPAPAPRNTPPAPAPKFVGPMPAPKVSPAPAPAPRNISPAPAPKFVGPMPAPRPVPSPSMGPRPAPGPVNPGRAPAPAPKVGPSPAPPSHPSAPAPGGKGDKKG